MSTLTVLFTTGLFAAGFFSSAFLLLLAGTAGAGTVWAGGATCSVVSELIIAKNSLVSASTVSGTSSTAVNEQIEYLESVTTSLHESVMKVRMVPIESTVSKFPRMVRDLLIFSACSGVITPRSIALFLTACVSIPLPSSLTSITTVV